MASAKENVPLAPKTRLPRQTSHAPPRRRSKVANGATVPVAKNGATEPAAKNGVTKPTAGGGILKCACFRLPSFSKNKPLPSPPPPPPPAIKLISNASRRRSAAAPNVASQRVTFRASASLSTWWPASPPSAGAGTAPDRGVVAGAGSVEPRRVSASAAPPRNAGAPRESSTSFSHWRRRSLSSRVMPHGERPSFSFHTSPVSASSSCMSTPKIPHGWQQR